MSRNRQALVRFGLALAVTLSLSITVSAKTLTEALADAGFQDIAEDVEKCVTSHSPLNPVIAVESFATPQSFGGDNFTTAGKAILQAMTETIQQHTSLDVVSPAEYTLRGDYTIRRIDENNERVTLGINCRIVNRIGVSVAAIESELTIDDPQAIAEFTGVSLEFPQADDADENVEDDQADAGDDTASDDSAESDDVENDAAVNDAADQAEEAAADATPVADAAAAAVDAQSEALDEVLGGENPQAAEVVGTVIRPAPDSPFGIEIRLTKQGSSIFETAQPTLSDGRTHIHVDTGDIYEVRLINDTERDVAVTLAIDGVNVFTFSDPAFRTGADELGTPVYSYYIVRRGRIGTVSGWFKNLGQVSEFEIAPSDQAAAGRVGLLDKIGTISATFAFAWSEGEEPPADEIPQAATASRGLGTKKGRTRIARTTELRRFVGGPRATVSVRYSDE